MRNVINPMTGDAFADGFDKVLTFGLTDAEIATLYTSVPTGTAVVSCNNIFESLLTTPCNCIVFAPSKINAEQKSWLNEIYKDEERILMLSTEDNKTGFKFPMHTINLSKKVKWQNKKLYSFLESAKFLCVSNCDGYMLNDGFVVVDIETTGLDREADELIFLSAVRVANMEIVDVFEMPIKPDKQIPKEIEEFCGITNEMVSSAENAQAVVSKLTNWIGMDVIVTYDRGFISNFLNPVFQKIGYEVNTKPRLNMFDLVRKLYANLLFSTPSRITRSASAIGIDLTEVPCQVHEARFLTDILLRLKNEYELRSVSELQKLY